MAAEQRRRYEEHDIRYGVDLRPNIELNTKPLKEEKPRIKVTATDKSIMLMILMAVSICMITIIFFHAYSADIKYNINKLNEDIDNCSKDIDNLNVELRSVRSLDSIEYYAINDLGMVYPGISQTVNVTELENSEKVNAYIDSLSASQRGFVSSGQITVADAARLLFAQS